MDVNFFGYDVNYLIVVGLAVIGALTILSIVVDDFLNCFKESRETRSIDKAREESVASELGLGIEQFELKRLIGNEYEVITREQDYNVLFKRGTSSIVKMKESFQEERIDDI